MSRGFGARAGLLAMALVLVVSSLPLATADHAYSHRFIVYGRVIDVNGDPVQGVTVNLGYENFHPESACGSQPGTETEAYGITQSIPVTNSWGEFMFCFHTHAMSRALPGTGILRIDEENNHTQRFDFDPYFRENYVVAKLDHASEKANKTAFDSAYVVQGRLWRPAGKTVYIEANPVFGYTINHAPVNITFEHDGTVEHYTTESNNYGDFAYRVNLTKRPTSGKVTIESEGETHTYDLNPSLGITAEHIEYAKQSDPFLKGLLIVGGVVVGVAVVGGAGWYGYRKMSAAREEQAIRNRAVRKRANK